MSQSYPIELVDHGTRGAVVIRNPSGDRPTLLAELDWRWSGDVMVATHTGVRPHLQGQGIARRLVDAAAEEARRRGARIDPRCSYVAKVFREHSETFADVALGAG